MDQPRRSAIPLHPHRQPDAKSILTTEKQVVAPIVKLVRQGRAQIVTITTTAHQGQPLGVHIACTLPDRAPQVSCRIHVINRSSLPLSGIRFPTLALPLRLGGSSHDDRVLLPMCDGMVLENPETNLADRQLYRPPTFGARPTL